MLQRDIIKSDSFVRVRCGQFARIDNAVSPERTAGLRSIRNWFTSTAQLMKSVQVKLQSSQLDMHFRESLLELTPVCHPQLKPGGKLSYKAQPEKDRQPLWQLYNLCLPFITQAGERQLIELKGRLKYDDSTLFILWYSQSRLSPQHSYSFRIRVLEKWCRSPNLKDIHIYKEVSLLLIQESKMQVETCGRHRGKSYFPESV